MNSYTDNDEIIPISKLDRLLTVSLNELEEYKIYTGFDGRELKLEEGKCYTWFESANPRYAEYLFQIPNGRPKDTLGNWEIMIRKLPNHFDLHHNELLGFMLEYGLNQDKTTGELYSNEPELSKYQFVKSMRKDKNNNVIGVRFDLVLRENWQREQKKIMDELFDWVIEKMILAMPFTLNSEEVARLKIWGGVDGQFFGTESQFNLKSCHSVLQGFIFSFPFGLPNNHDKYTLTVHYNNPEKGGSSRKRKNRTVRKSRK
jgi:hypothetical protein